MVKPKGTLQVLFFGLVALLLMQAVPSFAATDSDGDGISDTKEINGWSNNAGGPFHTNPNDPDSDNDGLSDGEEQLYRTNPLDVESPGIYARYSDPYRTRKYYSWIKYGTKYFAHGGDQHGTVIVRRGASLVVGGRPSATLSIAKSTPALTTLSPVPGANGVSWTIVIPGNGTVGSYTLKLTSGAWSKSLKLYVLFEIPAGLSAAEVAAYLYTEDAANVRDRFSIWFDANHTLNPNFDPTYEYYGWAYAFPTDQYKQYLLEGYILNSINGKATQSDAFAALAQKVDQVTRFDANVWPTSMEEALNSFERRNDCARIADVAVGFMRSAGIASRTVKTDWKARHFDHSTEGWIGTRWMTVRAWNNSNETDIKNPIEGGIYGPNTQYFHGHNKYTADLSAILMTMGPGWQWTEVNDGRHCGSSGTKKVYRRWYLPEQGRESPALTPGGIDRVAGWKSMTVPYWGWPSEPSTSALLTYPCSTQSVSLGPTFPRPEQSLQPVQAAGQMRSAGYNQLLYLWFLPFLLGLWAFRRARTQRLVLLGGACATLALTAVLCLDPSMLSFSQGKSRPQPARLVKVLSDYGIDTNSNGRIDSLAIDVEVEVNRPGSYTLIGHLNDSTPTPQTVGGYLATAMNYIPLGIGRQMVKLQFNGQTIYHNGEDGSYSLDELSLTDQQYPEEIDLRPVDAQQPGYHTAAYNRNSFENGGAGLSQNYDHITLDRNQDGYFDSLVVNTSLTINTPGLYAVEAELADAQGQLVATALWSGSGGQVALPFEVLLGKVTPYYLRNVHLYNGREELIDSFSEGDESSLGVYSTGPLYNLGLGELPPAYASPRVTSAKGKDGSGVDFQGFDVIVNTAIAVEGDYRLEAWLEGSDGEPFAWETSEPEHLSPGLRDLSLSFKERKIKLFKAKSPYKLVALKLLYGSDYTVVDQVDLAFDPGSAKH